MLGAELYSKNWSDSIISLPELFAFVSAGLRQIYQLLNIYKFYFYLFAIWKDVSILNVLLPVHYYAGANVWFEFHIPALSAAAILVA